MCAKRRLSHHEGGGKIIGSGCLEQVPREIFGPKGETEKGDWRKYVPRAFIIFK
jgi:hypothetical protein